MRSGRRRPLVLVITKIQNFQNNDQGRNLLLQIQQYAERWAIRGSVLMPHTSAIFLNFIKALSLLYSPRELPCPTLRSSIL
jgi:hypothetical protein